MCWGKAQGFGSRAQSALPCLSLICVATEFIWGGSLPSQSFSEFGKGVMLLEGDNLTISGSGINGGCLAGVGTLLRCTHTHSYIFTLSAIPLRPLTLLPRLFPFGGLPCYFRDTTRDGPNWACRSQEFGRHVCWSVHPHTQYKHITLEHTHTLLPPTGSRTHAHIPVCTLPENGKQLHACSFSCTFTCMVHVRFIIYMQACSCTCVFLHGRVFCMHPFIHTCEDVASHSGLCTRSPMRTLALACAHTLPGSDCSGGARSLFPSPAFIQQYFLSIYYVPAHVLDAGDRGEEN